MSFPSVSTSYPAQQPPPPPSNPAVGESRAAAPARPEPEKTETRKLEEEPAKAAPSSEDLSRAIKSLNKVAADKASDLSFSIDDNSGTQIVKIVDRATKTVIRQIPTEEAVKIAEALDKLQGLLIKDKA